MSFKFSGFTRRSTGSASPAAHSPQLFVQGLRPAVPAESPSIAATPTRVVPEAGPTVEYVGANRVQGFHRIFQASDSVPAHLKRSVPDRLLYRTTMALTVGGALYCLVALYMATQPSNK